MKLFCTIILLCYCATFSLARPITGDSTHCLTLEDTVFIKLGEYNQKLLQHTIEPKQTLYSLAKFYELSVEQLHNYNPALKESLPKVGQVISIPIPNRCIIRYREGVRNQSLLIPVFHVVGASETLYGLCKRTYRMGIDDIKQRNNLTDEALTVGQILQIGWMSIAGIPPSNTMTWKDTTSTMDDPYLQITLQLQAIYNESKTGQAKERDHRGLAKVSESAFKRPGFVAYHKYAPVNSIIRIHNPMAKKVVYALVIGRIPPSLQQWDTEVILVVPTFLGDVLGVVDPRFFAKVSYVK